MKKSTLTTNKLFAAMKNALTLLKGLIALAVFLIIFISASEIKAQTVVTNPTSPWIVPTCITSVTVYVWGGGGGGGGSGVGTFGATGGGGGGGAFATSILTVSPGQSYTITYGAGGTGGSAGTNGGNGGTGGTTTFTGTGGTVSAVGGGPGLSGAGNANYAGGAGGQASACTPTAGAYSGGHGATSYDFYYYGEVAYEVGGGGGGGAGSGANGADVYPASAPSGGPSTGGAGGGGTYPGGAGGTYTAAEALNYQGSGGPGSVPGGGGAGSGNADQTGNFPGGAGGSGQVIIIYSSVLSVSASSSTICSGSPSTLTASGATSYSWSTGGSTAAITVFPTTTTTYTVTGTSTGCTTTASITVNVTPNPTVNTVASVNPICAGKSTSLTASGATTYLWNGGLGTASTVSVSPTTNTTYTVTGTTSGCTGTSSITVNVNPNPTVSTLASVNPICAGNSTTLTASGATTYSWSGGLGTSNPVTATPTVNTTYTVTGTTSGCTGTSSVTINVTPNPTVSIIASVNPICPGNSTTLTASGATTYLWSGSLGTANPVTVAPTVNTAYTVTGTASGCTGTATITVNLNPLPVVSISASTNPICSGASTSLTASGATTYLWSGSLGTTNPVTVSPTVNTVYTVTGTLSGCTGTASVTVIVNPNPTVNTVASVNPICAGSSTTLTASGATTYLWNGGLGTASHITVSPTANTTYTVTGTTSGCTGTSSITINVTPNPTVTAIASVNPICEGNSTTLTASGATTYLWNGSLGTANPVTVSPTINTAYTVTGTTAGCTGTASISITVYTNPTVTTVASVNPICAGNSTTLTASGATTYLWSGGLGTSNPLIVSPTANTAYTVIGTTTGCTGTSSITITVNPNPTVSTIASANPICAGNSTTLTASGATTYLWSGGLGTSNPLTVSPTANTAYTVTGTTTGCTGTSSITITVNPNPTVSTIASANPICAGNSTTLTASGATTYLWNGSLGTSNPLIVSPTANTVYTVTGTTTGCTGTASITVTVYPLPTPTIIATGNNLTCSPSYTSYLWDYNGNYAGNTQTITCVGNGNYSVTATDNNGCTNSASISSFICHVGISEINSDNNFVIYPNPVNDNITIEYTSLNNIKDAMISIYNIEGKLLIKQPMLQAKTYIDISSFSDGMYYVKLKTEKGVAVKKFVKQ